MDYKANTNPIITQGKLYHIYNLQFNNMKTFISNTHFNVESQEQVNGETLLSLAIQNENYTIASYLLDLKVNPNCRNKYQKTPLHYAIEINNHKLINLLLENNADPNLADSNGDTSLHIAAYIGDYKVIKLLLLYKANTKIKNRRQMFAIDCSRENCHFKCVNLLSEKSGNKTELNPRNIKEIQRLKTIKSCVTYPTQLNESLCFKEDISLTSDRNKKNTNRGTKNNQSDLFVNSREIIFEDNNIAESMISHSQEKNEFPWFGTEKGIAINFENSKQMEIITPFIDIEQFTSFGNYKDIIEITEEFINEGKQLCVIQSINNQIKEDDVTNMSKELQFRKSTPNLRKENKLKYSLTRESKQINSFEEIECFISMYSFINKRNTISHKINNRLEINRKEDKEFDAIDEKEVCKSYSNEEEDNIIIDNSFEQDENAFYTTSNCIKSEDYCSNDIIESNLTEEDEFTYKHTKTSISEISLENILRSIGMESYISLLIKEGFDDISLILNQTKNGYGISDKQLKEAGILIPGHRARILIKLQEESKGFDFVFQSKNAYYYLQSPFNEGLNDYQIKILESWLRELKMEHYLKNFYEGSYHSLDLLLLQMVSWNPLDDDLLRNELKIDKLGYRARIINQLKEDSIKYTMKLKLKKIEYTNQLNINQNSCKCIIY